MAEKVKQGFVLIFPAGPFTRVHINVHPLSHCVKDEWRQMAFLCLLFILYLSVIFRSSSTSDSSCATDDAIINHYNNISTILQASDWPTCRCRVYMATCWLVCEVPLVCVEGCLLFLNVFLKIRTHVWTRLKSHRPTLSSQVGILLCFF